MNLVVQIGRVATNPEAKETTGGKLRCSFRIAVGRGYKGPDGREPCDFFTVVAWKEVAKTCQTYLTKGRQVAVRGKLTTYRYQAQDGSNRTETQIEAERVQFLGSRQEEAAPPPEAPDDFMPVDDDDLPF